MCVDPRITKYMTGLMTQNGQNDESEMTSPKFITLENALTVRQMALMELIICVVQVSRHMGLYFESAKPCAS